MKPELQRVAIAEACGWKLTPEQCFKWRSYFPPKGYPVTFEQDLPDYLTDLNACHEMEKVLTAGNQTDVYSAELRRITDRDSADMHPAAFSDWHATAAQRAEAFLRTLNLWKDET